MKTIELPIDKLLLDPSNMRLYDRDLSQNEIFEYLIKYEDLEDLARDFAKFGDLQIAILIGLKDGDKYYMLEGNRRLAACKLLKDPKLAPQKYQKLFREISSEKKYSINKLNVRISPTRKEADVLIAQIHRKPAVKRWSTISQNNFYLTKIAEGTSPKNLSKMYNVSENNIKKAVIANKMYGIAKRLELPKDVKEKVINPREFNFTTLVRIFDNKIGRNFLGISYSNSGEILIKDRKIFENKLKKIIIDIAKKNINSRSLNTTTQKESYFKSISEKDFDKPSQLPKIIINEDTNKISEQTEENAIAKEIKTQDFQKPPFKLPPPPPRNVFGSKDSEEIIKWTTQRFGDVVAELGEGNRKSHTTLTVKDEYDVQYLTSSLLKLFFDDVKREEPTPTLGPLTSKADIFLFEQEIVIECKVASKKLTAVKITKDLILDIATYERHPNIKCLFFFIFDPDRNISNFQSLKSAIEGKSSRLNIQVLLSR